MINLLSSPKDLLEKAKYDLSLFGKQKSELLDCYSIFNILVSIDHLFDWVLKYEAFSVDYKKTCIKIFNPYHEDSGFPLKKYYKDISPFPEPNHNQEIIRDLCNNFKHYKIEKRYIKERKNYLAQAGYTYAGGYNAYAGYYETYQFVIIGNNEEEIDIVTLFNDSIREWDIFLNSTN